MRMFYYRKNFVSLVIILSLIFCGFDFHGANNAIAKTVGGAYSSSVTMESGNYLKSNNDEKYNEYQDNDGLQGDSTTEISSEAAVASDSAVSSEGAVDVRETSTPATTEPSSEASSSAVSSATPAAVESATPTETAVASATPAEQTGTPVPTTAAATAIPTTAPIQDFHYSTLNPLKSTILVFDPGHCNKHPGARYHGLREEKVVLKISKACNNELKQYGDVIVHFTRTDGKCCEKLGLGDCLSCRNNLALRLDADFLISFHINASYYSWTNGANVLTPYNSGYRNNVRKKSQKLGKLILKQLKRIGIKNNGLLLRLSSTSRYPNGKRSDYYSIVRRGVVFNIPSIIIEHGYLSCLSECQKYFNTSAKCKKVGGADAEAIIKYFKLKNKTIDGKFKTIDGKDYFIDTDGKKVVGWVKYKDKFYYMDPETGEVHKKWLVFNGEKFFMNKSSGYMKTGWFSNNGKKYLARGNGSLVAGQKYTDGIKTYKFDSNGVLQ
ncbi:MAG: N-acetylmuramoyl-L-alanine amidase [Lachnospiraceae bacterium]|nr:N-acetylmuramoyl-L-alanine amidase [Lachnospiraceae bacterium]